MSSTDLVWGADALTWGGEQLIWGQPTGVRLPLYDAIELIFEVSAAIPLAASQDWRELSVRILKDEPVTVDRGRTAETDEWRTGTLGLRLGNNDGELDPPNTASEFAEVLKPRRQCRLRVRVDGTTHDLFRGTVRGWPRRYRRPNVKSWVPLTASDGFRLLSQSDLTEGAFTLDHDTLGLLDVGRLAGDDTGEQHSGELVDAILDAAGWPTDLRAVDQGMVLVDAQGDADDALAALREAEKAEGGSLFVDRSGQVVFLDRLAPYEDARLTQVQHTFGIAVGQIRPGSEDQLAIEHDDSRIVNDSTYTGISGVPQNEIDDDSIDEHGRITDPNGGTVIAVSNDDARSLAVLAVSRGAWPTDRVEQIEIPVHRDPATLVPLVAQMELLDRVRVIYQPPGEGPAFDAQLAVQGVRHDITSHTWVTTLRLGPTPAEVLFTLDDELLGLLDGEAVLAP